VKRLLLLMLLKHVDQVKFRDGVLDDCPRARGQLEDPKSWPWPWPLTVLALASKWSGLGLGLDASASSHPYVINVLNL